MKMGPGETPPSSPCVQEEIVEEIDDDLESLHDGNVEIIEDYQVEEIDDNEDGGEEMIEAEVIEAMEREDAICIFEKHIASVFCGSLNKDGNFAVTGGEDDKAYVWNTKTGEIVLECTDHKDSVIFADFSFDDMYLATGDMNGIIQVRKTSDKTVIWDYDMKDATWMQWHRMAHVLLAGSVAGEVYMWKIPEGECKIVQGFGEKAATACLFPDGKRLVVGYEDGVLRIIDLKAGSVVSTISSNIGSSTVITALDCHPDNNLILSAAVDGKTILSAANTGRILTIVQNLKGKGDGDNEDAAASDISKGDWVEAICFLKDPSQQIAASGTINGDIYIWDIAKNALRHRIDQGSGVTKLLWKETSWMLFSAGLDGIMRCYDGRSAECLRTFLGHTEAILDICLSKDGKLALTTSDDTTARIFEIEAN